jgi:hypothetical protein
MSIDDKVLLVFLSITFMVIQFITSIVNRKWTREVIDEMVKGFEKIGLGFIELKNQIDVCNMVQNKEIEEIRDKTVLVHNIVTKTDNDGSPLIFVPRSWGSTQKEIADVCRMIASTQKSMLKIMDRIDERQSKTGNGG